MSQIISVSDADLNYLHLASTPIAVLAEYGLKTYAGLSGDDPGATRNKDARFTVILSAYGDNALIGRAAIAELGPREHRFFCLDDELEKLNWLDKTRLCVVHRVPTGLLGQAPDQAPKISHTSFSMYRTVVQYESASGGKGSVIYETPPNFNMRGKTPHFLTFSNKIYLSEGTKCRLILLNYSVSPDYRQTAEVQLEFCNAAGEPVARKTETVSPFDFHCMDIDEVLAGHGDTFVSFTASSVTSALIPLSVIVSKSNGGVSVEHSHPPQEYLMADWSLTGKIKIEAARHLFAN